MPEHSLQLLQSLLKKHMGSKAYQTLSLRLAQVPNATQKDFWEKIVLHENSQPHTGNCFSKARDSKPHVLYIIKGFTNKSSLALISTLNVQSRQCGSCFVEMETPASKVK